MNARFLRVAGVVALLVCFGPAALAQEAPPVNGAAAESQPANAAPANNITPTAADMQAVARAIEGLSTRLDQMDRKIVTREQLNEAIRAETEAAMSRFATKVELENYVPRSEFDALERKFNELQTSFDDQAEQIRQFQQNLSTQVTALDDQAQQIQQIVDTISRPDSQQRRILDINSSMASQEFQRDFSGAMHNSMQRQGRLLVSNQMSTTQFLRVNGQLMSIPPFTTNHEIPVPVGTLTTELTGEAPKNWTISPPTYEQGIIIAPRQPSVVVASPVVYWSY